MVALAACNPATESSPAKPQASAQAPAPAASPLATAHAVGAVQFGPAIPADLQSPPAESGGECGIEATPTVPQGGELQFARSRVEHVEGWALVRDAKAEAEHVYLKLASNGNASYFALATPISRPGLGIRLGDASLDRAGFTIDVGLQDVPAGKYTVQVAQRINGRVLLCATGRSATVTD